MSELIAIYPTEQRAREVIANLRRMREGTCSEQEQRIADGHWMHGGVS